VAGKQTCRTFCGNPLAPTIDVTVAAVELGADLCPSAISSQQLSGVPSVPNLSEQFLPWSASQVPIVRYQSLSLCTSLEHDDTPALGYSLPVMDHAGLFETKDPREYNALLWLPENLGPVRMILGTQLRTALLLA
jgi:hypothetical protein